MNQTLLDQEQPDSTVPAVRSEGDNVTLMFERLAKDPAVDVEKLERLIAMQERILTHQAKASFNRAFATMQGEIPAIVEKGRTNNGTYARLEDIVEQVRPILQKHGFTLSHRTEWPDQKTVRVVGILTHQDGHERTSEFLSGADASGNKNAIQGYGSAVSYGRRYTTKDLLNIVTRDEDDDGQSAGRKPVAAPEGFDNWWIDLELVAKEGTKALSEAWNKSRKDYRKHLAATNPEAWEKLKREAAKVAQ